MNIKVVLGSLGGAVVLHAVIAACSNANAQSEPSVQVVSCDKTFQGPTVTNPDDPTATPTPLYYAEAAYPGLTANQIAGHVTNWTTVTPGMKNLPSNYTLDQQLAVYVRDGFAGAGCTQGTTTTFIYVP
jgi:hypothetical protein